MKKTIIILLLTAICAASLFSCGNKDSAPEGLQTANVSESIGYIFYAPEHWSVVNTESISAARLSNRNISVTFTEAPAPLGDLNEYFSASIASLPEVFQSTLKILVNGESCLFGNADGECLKYVYTYEEGDAEKIEDNPVFMQILINHGSRFFIFTYASYGDVNDETSDYRRYLEDVQLSIDNFTFTVSNEVQENANYPKDSDGYNMVSNEDLAKFKLYLPSDYEVVYSGAYVKAKASDGAAISLIEAQETGIDILDYLRALKSGMSKIATDFTDVSITFTREIPEESTVMKNWDFQVLPSCNENLVFGNLDKSTLVEYEYTYVHNGQTYRVYQAMGTDYTIKPLFGKGYVFTYTAVEDEYDAHIDEIKTILEKVRF